jgi:hypothetical protein
MLMYNSYTNITTKDYKMKEKLDAANIQFPQYWSIPKVAEAFQTLSTLELYEYFGCPSATSYSRMMNKYMPNRPPKVSFAEYIKMALA